jgi:hypothetical protein
MTKPSNDRSQKAIDDLNNNVDQKRLAYENSLLRWLVVLFAVALTVTLIFYPHLEKVDTNEIDTQHLRDYSGSAIERSASGPYIQRSSDVVQHSRPVPTWVF